MRVLCGGTMAKRLLTGVFSQREVNGRSAVPAFSFYLNYYYKQGCARFHIIILLSQRRPMYPSRHLHFKLGPLTHVPPFSQRRFPHKG